MDTRRDTIRERLSRIAPHANRYHLSLLEISLEVAMVLEYLYKVMRHYYLWARESENLYLFLQLQMLTPDILKLANAYHEAQEYLSEGVPMGDAAGPLVIENVLSLLASKHKLQLLENNVDDEIVIRRIKVDSREIYVVRAEGPNAFVGKPGAAIQKIIETEKSNLKAVI